MPCRPSSSPASSKRRWSGVRGRGARRDHRRGARCVEPPDLPSSTAILRGSRPARRDPPARPGPPAISDFPAFPMPTPASEINLIETFADTKVIGLTINHEHMTDSEVSAAIALYEVELGIPATDALTRSTDRLVDMVFAAFPDLRRRRSPLDERTASRHRPRQDRRRTHDSSSIEQQACGVSITARDQGAARRTPARTHARSPPGGRSSVTRASRTSNGCATPTSDARCC